MLRSTLRARLAALQRSEAESFSGPDALSAATTLSDDATTSAATTSSCATTSNAATTSTDATPDPTTSLSGAEDPRLRFVSMYRAGQREVLEQAVSTLNELLGEGDE